MIGKGMKVRAKCPICARTSTVSVEKATLTNTWQVFYCSGCNEKFRLQKGWRKRLLERRGGI
jgi:hypothetical protein